MATRGALSAFPLKRPGLGGKVKSKKWSKSIYHENIQLGTFLSSVGISVSRSDSQSPRQLSPLRAGTPDASSPPTRGDAVKLRQSLLSYFDTISLKLAVLIWSN